MARPPAGRKPNAVASLTKPVKPRKEPETELVVAARCPGRSGTTRTARVGLWSTRSVRLWSNRVCGISDSACEDCAVGGW